MNVANRFSFKSLAELLGAMARRGCDMPCAEDMSVLGEPVGFGRLVVPNRLVCQPMEGCDGEPDGSPGELTLRKYLRFAAGGAGMIWFEACAVAEEGRANPRQLWLHEGNLASFADMVRQTKQAAVEAGGPVPICVLQMTHSGRYCRPAGTPSPIIAHHSGALDRFHNLPADYPLIADERLDALQDAYVASARLAVRAGFDAVDVKACHCYLLSELLAAHTRGGSRYGGSYENRTRMLRETAGKVVAGLAGEAEVTCRLNAYDALAYPYGWGVDREDVDRPDLAEPIRLIGELRQAGLAGVNITMGNPRVYPHVVRPHDRMVTGQPTPPEDPMTGQIRIIEVVRNIQRAVEDFPVVGSGYSWLRQYGANIVAGLVRDGWTTLAGFGRGALACPDFAREILTAGRLDARKVCVTCSACSQIMRDGGRSGCVVRDANVYLPIYRAGRQRAAEKMSSKEK